MRVLDRLRWRQPSVPVITIAGTNGKGSVAAYCTAILGAAGHRVGTFTSPHLRDYRERIRVHEADGRQRGAAVRVRENRARPARIRVARTRFR